VVLTLLAIMIAALLALAVVATFAPRIVVSLGSAGIAGLVILAALAAMAGIDPTATLALPLGPAGAAMRLALDPLGAAFLLLVFLAATPCALFADTGQAASLAGQPASPAGQAGSPAGQAASLAGLPASLAALALTLLAADAFTLILGLLLLALATGSSLRLTTFGVVCLIAAFALAAPTTIAWPDCDFAAMRAAPPDGWRAGVVLVLVLLGAGSQAGHATRATLPAVAGTTIGSYLLIRMLLDLLGPAQPLWWGVPLLVVGAIAAVAGSLRAAVETTLQSVLSLGGLHQLGLATIGIGVALLARAVDLPDVALLALEATWLLLVAHVLCRTLLLLCAGAVETGAGTRRLDRLGGLAHGMPIIAICTLAGLFGVAVLPPGLGFAGFWLLFQALLGAARVGGFGLQLVIAVAAALAALSTGLSVMAAVRLFGVAFLGRPRTPRTAVAEDAPFALRAVLIGLAAATGLLGVVPALALLPAAPALAYLANSGSDTLALALTLRPGAEAPGYAPAAIAGLLAVAGCAVFWLLYRGGSQSNRREPAWSGGFAAPPAWLPFGEPATQYGPASFAEPLQRVLRILPLPLIKRIGGGGPTPNQAPLRSPDRRPDANRHPLRRAIRAAVRANAATSLAATSIAATLIVIVLAAAAWLVAP
jgi:hydrogenase-4 component B